MYPEDSFQRLIEPWWAPAHPSELSRGQLIRTFVPYPEHEPLRLIPEGRADPRDHSQALVRIERYRMGQPMPKPGLPVAALPLHEGESYFVQRGKIRPALVISTGGEEVSRELQRRATQWQIKPTALVAPYYGAESGSTRGGWHPEFVTRIRRAEYPQYVWDILPVAGADESILRLDHVFAIAKNPNAYQKTEHRLSPEALEIVDQWVFWLITGGMGEELSYYREELRKLPGSGPA